ncbi:MAG: hypothetical protein C5B51_31250 [Terriglobia bacterium]|nr:MAG: hypothetical protein C5B51_31250 [Terriglobia bacterium]
MLTEGVKKLSFRSAVCWFAAAGAALGTLCAFQLPFREFPGVEYRIGDIPLPPDWGEKTEWAFARLMYPPSRYARYGGFRFGGGQWTEGFSIWTQDYPRADRHFVQALRRLTRLHVRSVEQPVNLDEGGVFDWPWLYAVQTGSWQLTDAQAKELREYLLRGGFFMCDDFWGDDGWAVFVESMQRVFPDRPIVELQNADQIFHTVYDLNDRYQVASEGSVARGRTNKCDGCKDHWRGIYDDHGRVMVAMTFNSDVGDSWEWADAPYYPEKYAALGIRIGVNYVIYAMTH